MSQNALPQVLAPCGSCILRELMPMSVWDILEFYHLSDIRTMWRTFSHGCSKPKQINSNTTNMRSLNFTPTWADLGVQALHCVASLYRIASRWFAIARAVDVDHWSGNNVRVHWSSSNARVHWSSSNAIQWSPNMHYAGTVRRLPQSNFFQSEQHPTDQPTPHLSTNTQILAMHPVMYSLNVECVDKNTPFHRRSHIGVKEEGLRYLLHIFHKSLDNTVIFTSDVIKWSDDNALISDDQMIMMWYCSDMIRSSDDNAMMITSVWSKGTP